MNTTANVGTTLLSRNDVTITIFVTFISHLIWKIMILTNSFINFVEACAQWKKPSFYGFILKINIRYGWFIEIFNLSNTYPLSLFIWYIPLESMMVGELFLIIKLNDGVKYNLQEWIQLGEYQPNINHPYIRGGWQFGHHTKMGQWWHWMRTFIVTWWKE